MVDWSKVDIGIAIRDRWVKGRNLPVLWMIVVKILALSPSRRNDMFYRSEVARGCLEAPALFAALEFWGYVQFVEKLPMGRPSHGDMQYRIIRAKLPELEGYLLASMAAQNVRPEELYPVED